MNPRRKKVKKKNLSRRNFLKYASLTSLGLTLAACAPTPQTSTEKPTEATPADTPTEEKEATPPPAEALSISLWGWWDLRMKIYEDVAKTFMEKNPDVKITVETLPGEELQQKVYSAVAAGTGPSMLKMGEFFFKMREQNMLLAFPEDIFPSSWYREAYPNVDWEAYGPYVVPTGTCGTILVYNKRMFKEAGLDPDSPPATWDDFINTAKALTKKDASGAVSQAGFVPSEEWPGLSQIYQLGGNIVKRNGDKQTATLDSPEAEKAFTHLADLVFKHTVWDPTFPNNLESVGTGVAAMTEDQSWVLGEFSGTYADIYPELGFAPNPTPTGKPEPLYGYKSTVLDISAMVSGRTEEYMPTFRFLEYHYKEGGKDAFWKLCELVQCAPERADLFDDPRLKTLPGLQKVAEVLPYEHDPVQPPEELYTIWQDVLNRAVIEGEPVPNALAYGNGELQKLLDQGLAKNLR
jgi:ABC-type glycerol-3-phosphate transport system substrate-binding protein